MYLHHPKLLSRQLLLEPEPITSTHRLFITGAGCMNTTLVHGAMLKTHLVRSAGIASGVAVLVILMVAVMVAVCKHKRQRFLANDEAAIAAVVGRKVCNPCWVWFGQREFRPCPFS